MRNTRLARLLLTLVACGSLPAQLRLGQYGPVSVNTPVPGLAVKSLALDYLRANPDGSRLRVTLNGTRLSVPLHDWQSGTPRLPFEDWFLEKVKNPVLPIAVFDQLTVPPGGWFDNPESEEDYCYDGYANHLLGNEERARYDYDRSRGFSRYYGEMAI